MYSVVLATLLTVGGDGSTGFGGRFRCHGCSGCHGCSTSCHRCSGCHGCSGCWGCYGCHAACSGWGCYGCWGCHGCHGGVIMSSCHGCYSCSGCHSCVGMVSSHPVIVNQAVSTSSDAQVARFNVRVPEKAQLWVDDTNCPLTSDSRSFRTPKLETGKRYFYNLKMEVERDGSTLTMTRRVDFSAGQQVNVDLTDLATATVKRD